jgi:hypothetical protein
VCDATLQGEISLRGRVTAVGGIKEKLIGALRAGVKTVLLPAQNRKDVKDLPQEVRDGLEIIHVRYVVSLDCALKSGELQILLTWCGTVIFGRLFVTFGRMGTGPERMRCLLFRVGCE